jgi:tRNA dimethylallyltransferase
MVLAQRLNGVVINADSMQVYRDLRILTARPSPADEALVPHALYGMIDAADRFSAGRWRDMAIAAITQAHAAGQRAIVTGGTGFYLEALTAGLSPIPDVPPEVTAEAAAKCDAIGLLEFARELAENDPDSVARIAATDRQRLVRASAVWTATGRSLSDWHGEAPQPAPFPSVKMWLNPPRDLLYERCDRRLQQMIDAGALAEVEALLVRGLDPNLPAMKALGMADLAAHLRGALPLEQAIASAQQATRRFAKRQLTWFRHRLNDAMRIDAQFSESFSDEIISFIRKLG